MKKPILIFGLIILLSIGIYAWFYPLNKGTLAVSVQPEGILVFIGGTATPCAEKTCAFELKPNRYSITIRKDGYFPYFEEVTLSRGQTAGIQTELELIPDLVVSQIIPLETEERAFKPAPPLIDPSAIVTGSWNKDLDRFAFLDANDERLKIWQNSGIGRITQVRNTTSALRLIWSPNNRHILGQDGSSLYFIDIEKASRHKVSVGFIPQNLSWSPDGSRLIANDSRGNLYLVGFAERSIKAVDLDISLAQAVWKDDRNLVIYTVDDFENRTDIEQYSLSTGERTPIVTKFDFPVSKITRGEDGNIYLYNSNDRTWYVLQQ